MSKYYSGKRTRNIYTPGKNKKPFKLSRSKIDLFVECPRCFYIDRRLGVGRPPGYPFAINSAVDLLLKKEFDVLRKSGDTHPLIKEYGVDARPVPHAQLDEWRENFKGVRYLHESTDLLITGAIDDLWQNSKGEYIVVDYKATSKNEEITELNKAWQDSYKRQMEIYQWLLRKNELKVSDTGYFVYCNGRTDVDSFDGKIEFDLTLIGYKGNDDWVEGVIENIYKCLNSDNIPKKGVNCDYCLYRDSVEEVIK
ncbi:MAG: PD-(D/E)XK nuclease family protein [Candidatus Spechtbacterales bacterium]|nr:PD-(D/E)XK nuclease family protein [Candidatus Spechtbacterales bacterium]